MESRIGYYHFKCGNMVAELENLSEQLNAANVFVDENVQNGRRQNIAIYYGDKALTYQDFLDHEFIARFFGAIKIGAFPLPANTMLKANDYQYFLNDSSAKTLIVHDILLPEIEKIKGNLKYLVILLLDVN